LWQLLVIQPDLVHFSMVQQPVLYLGKVVTTMHDLTTLRFSNPSKNPLAFWIKQRVYYWVNFVAAHKSKAIITPTEYVKGDVARTMRTNSRKITVTHESGNTITSKPEAMPEFEQLRYVMYLGRPFPHKNLGRLIEAYALLKQSMPDLHLVLVGKTDALYKRHQARVERLGIPDVHFTGFATDAQARWLYEHAAVYVFPSLSEGFGLPGLEAMAHGAPVASSNATCLPELYGDAALYFDPRSVDDMANAIRQILEKPDLRKKLIAAGYKQTAKYSWRRMAEQTLAVYRRILDEDD
jgi:glycosyltransferase involved in cell wall biosynthesis